jgi:hypothetical protein
MNGERHEFENSGKLVETNRQKPHSLRGVKNLTVQQEIASIETEYKDYASATIGDLALSINLCRTGESFQHVDNSIYIPSIGTQPAISDLSKAAIKHQNYIQIVLDSDRVIAKYLASFFQSALGGKIREAGLSQTVIPKITKSALHEMIIPIPNIETQREIINTLDKLELVVDRVHSFERNLALNPIGARETVAKIDAILDAVGDLVDSEKIKSVVRAGESKTVEFKQTLSLDLKTQTKQKYIEDAAIKTVAAFLNTDGGLLIVGVQDDSKIVGVGHEIDMFHKNKDKFLLHFKNLLKTRVGEQFYPFVNQRLVEVDSKTVFLVECRQSTTAVYVDDREFYVRTNPATDKLEGPQLVAYVQHHFGRS